MILENVRSVFFKVAKMGGIGVFIFSFQFLHAFGLAIWMPVSLQIAMIMLLFHGVIGVADTSHGRSRDLLLPGTLLCGVFPLFVFWSQAGLQNVLYSAAWLVIPLIYFWGGRVWLHASGVTLDQIGRAAYVSVIFLSFSIVFEFILVNATGLYISDFIPFSIAKFPEANLLEDMYIRPRGFTAEAGFSAVVFEALTPLAFFYVRNDKWKRFSLLALIAPGYLMLSSAASMLCITVALLFPFLLLSKRKAFRLSLVVVFMVAIVLAYANVTQIQWFLDQIIIRKLLEFNLQVDAADVNNTVESFSRLEVYSLGLKLISDFPLGIGWGMLSQMKFSGVLLPGVHEVKGTGFISIPLEITVSAGVIGGGMFLFFVIGKIRQVFRITNEIRPYLFIALTAVALHHVVILEFWFPMFWFLLALSDYVEDREKWNTDRGLLPTTQAT